MPRLFSAKNSTRDSHPRRSMIISMWCLLSETRSPGQWLDREPHPVPWPVWPEEQWLARADQRKNQGSDSYGMKDVKSEVIRRKERCWRFQEWPFCGPQLSWFLWLVDSRSCSFQSSPYYATQRSSGCFERFRNCDDTVQVWIVTTRIVMSFCLVQGKTHFHSRTGHQSQQAMWGRNDLFAVEVPVRLIVPGFCVSTRFHCSASNAKQTCLFCTWPSFSDAVESHIFWIRVTENFSLYAQSSNCTSSCHKNILYTVVTYT